MTTYKSELIEFRAGRIILTEAEWTANANVYPEGIIAITSDGSNAGNTKVFNGTSYWSQLAYNSGGGSGGATNTDQLTNVSDVPGDTASDALETLAGNFADNSAAIDAVSTAVSKAKNHNTAVFGQPSVVQGGTYTIIGETAGDGGNATFDLTAAEVPMASAYYMNAWSNEGTALFAVPVSEAVETFAVAFYDATGAAVPNGYQVKVLYGGIEEEA